MSQPKDILRLVTHRDDPLPTREPEASGEDEYAALADLFLSGGESDETSEAATVDADVNPIEALIVGHLPVMGSAWVRQHARQTSQELARPVALLRISAGHATLDIFGDAQEIEDAIPAADLDAGIRTAARLCPHWMVRTDAIAEPSLARTEAIGELTLLTGADEAAIVSAYRAIKSIISQPEGDPTDAEDLLSVVIMGADADQAADARLRIRRAGEAFLGRTLDVRPGPEQIHPGASTTVFRGETAVTLERALELAASPDLTPPTDPAPKPDRKRISSPAAETAPAPARAPTPEPKPSVHIRRQSNSKARAPHAFVPSAPSGAPGNPPRDIADSHPGLEPLADACPIAPSVRLATDAAGTVYLIAEATEPEHVGRVATDLQSAIAWYRAHAALLASVARRTLNPVPVARLITREATWVRHLLDSGLDAGLDIRLRVPPAQTDTLVPLNTPQPDAG